MRWRKGPVSRYTVAAIGTACARVRISFSVWNLRFRIGIKRKCCPVWWSRFQRSSEGLIAFSGLTGSRHVEQVYHQWGPRRFQNCLVPFAKISAWARCFVSSYHIMVPRAQAQSANLLGSTTKRQLGLYRDQLWNPLKCSTHSSTYISTSCKPRMYIHM